MYAFLNNIVPDIHNIQKSRINMNLNNGNIIYAAMHAGSHKFYTMVAPMMHCCMKHVIIAGIHMLILDHTNL